VVFGVALLAVVLNYSLLRARDDTVRVAVAARDLVAGAAVTPDAFRFTRARLDDRVLGTLLQPETVGEADGWVATGLVPAGDLVRRSDLLPPAAEDGRRAMSLPLEPEHAVAGELAPGDRVDVLEVRGDTARYVVTGAEVLAVADAGGAVGLTGAGAFSVTLAVDDHTALRLALALRSDAVEVVRSTGAPLADTAGLTTTRTP
jgi:Flp pilus assembly protein CpaB